MDNKQMEEIHEMAQITLGKQVTIECTKYAIEEGFFDNFIALYNAGYRKIDNGSVVLTEEEYTALKLIEEYHIKSCGKNSVVLTAEEIEIQQENYLNGIKYWQDMANKARKETAKEICEMGENLYKMSYHKSNAMPRLVAWIKSNFGLEIKE